MKIGLRKSKSTTKDFNGCEFGYTRYTRFDYRYDENGNFKLMSIPNETFYIDDVFGNCTSTLNELKTIMTKM